ncbi:hypothetical protein FALBO_294 [Fusarium albosuccineum]|uniref:Uncharacterized protein n=1 Tax=Fusarium albosuccineum TaxID=1237068 RepID=A0A8H4PME5_9HYPO|nr:hypothetical protein FALBO_294 [Fusarium albosuccineum]
MAEQRQLDPPATGPSRVSSMSIATLGAAKVALGVGCIVAPQLTGRIFLMEIATESVLMARLFGSSCAALGAATWNMNKQVGRMNVGKENLKTLVMFNITADIVDVLSCTAGYVSGTYGLPAFAMLGGGCLILAVLGIVGHQGI